MKPNPNLTNSHLKISETRNCGINAQESVIKSWKKILKSADGLKSLKNKYNYINLIYFLNKLIKYIFNNI